MSKTLWMLVGLIGVACAVAFFVRNRDRGQPDDTFKSIGWQALSDFKYDTYEVLNEIDGGRPFIRSDDVIPTHIKALDGYQVAVSGFIMPLRLKKGLVTEFLLFKDQAACCFGPAAKMNHYIRVKMKTEGFPPPGTPVTYTAYGLLRVGEIKVQGYLTGIYELEAEKVVEQKG